MEKWKVSGFIATAVIVLAIPVYIALSFFETDSVVQNDALAYIGKERCIDCHQKEYKAWLGSHHDKAMDIAADSTVLGDFDNASFESNGFISKFYKKNDRFFVYTNGPGGKPGEFEITHTFGFTPLQQYLVPFENGRYQCLPIAWDSEKNKWFSLAEATYGDDIPEPSDWLYWTNNGQNWNGMCAECHSTNLQKNYDPATKTFNTTYSEIDVSCEACHGPGSKHEEWANLPEMARPTNSNFELLVKTSKITNKEYVALCAYCHSRRSSLSGLEFTHGDLMDFIVPSVLNENYFPDGQILEENYVYGSFIHSKMYDNDVMCNDCHDVHSGKLLFEGNDLCAQCHQPEVYDTYSHHFHKKKGEDGKPLILKDRIYEVGEGAQCINCHMPSRYYMGNDLRNDHSFRVPRPDLSISIGVPNVCNQCHSDKSYQWSDDYMTKWYGEKRKFHFGQVFAKGRKSDPAALDELIKILKNGLYLPIVRASAASLLANYYNDKSSEALIWAMKADEPIIRYSALHSFSSGDADLLLNNLLPLLNDPVKALRMEAGFKLSVLPQGRIPAAKVALFKSALHEYKKAMNYSADFAGSRHNLGILNSNLQNFETAAEHYREAVRIDSLFFPSKVNLSVTLNQLGLNDEAESVLRDLIQTHPEFHDSYYSLGLLLAEKKDYEGAVNYLQKAAELMPDRARIFYNLGLIYQFQGKNLEAEDQLLTAERLEQKNIDFKYALADHYIKTEQYSKAKAMGNIIKENFPELELGDQILNYLNSINSEK